MSQSEIAASTRTYTARLEAYGSLSIDDVKRAVVAFWKPTNPSFQPDAHDILHMAEAIHAALALSAEVARPLQNASELTEAARDLLAERRRQVEAENWAPEHDDTHDEGEMAAAASCYALATVDGRNSKMLWRQETGIPLSWPWAAKWWKPTTPRHDLVKAGALILAEIERLDRLPPVPVDREGGR